MAKKLKKSALPEPKRLAMVANIVMVLLLIVILVISLLCYQAGAGYLFVLWAPLSAYIVVFYAYLVHILKCQNIELANQNESLLKALQRKSEFIYRVAHQLRTPLTAIKGSIELLLNKDLGEITKQQERFLDTIEGGLEYLKGLVSSLLEHSMVTSGRAYLEIKMTNLQQLIDETITTIKPMADKKKITLEMMVPRALPDVPVDGEKLKLALTNILDNAIKFTPQNGRVAVQAREWDDCIQVGVVDTGCGVSQERYEAIFDEFSKSFPLTIAKGGGPGLGLAVAKGIIESHGGEIWVESEPKKGSIFSFVLPKENQSLGLLKKRREIGKLLSGGLKLTDFIKPEVLQEIQDHFSQAMGVTTFIIDTEGNPITEVSQPNKFCALIRNSQKGREKCRQFDIKIGDDSLKDNRPKAYYSFTGLAHFAAPIIVENTPMGSIQIEGVQLFTPIDPSKLKQLSKDLNINYDELVEAASEIKKLSESKVYAASDLLYSIAFNISTLCSHEHELTTKIAQLSTLCHLGRAITSTLEFERLLNLVLYTTMTILDGESGSIMILDRDTQELTIRAAYGLKKEIVRRTRVPIGKQISGWVAKEKKPLLLHRKIDDPFFLKLMRVEGISSSMSVPLIIQNEVVGVFNINRGKSPDFNSEDLNMFLTLASQAAIAIEEAQLYQAMEEKTHQLEAFTKIGRTILSTLGLEKVLDLIIEAAVETIKVKMCSMHLIDPTGKLSLVASRGLSKEYIQKTELEVNQQVIIKAVENKEAFWIPDLKGRKGLEEVIAGKEAIASLLCVPLVIREVPIGAITVYSTKKHDYAKDEINLLSGFADQAAIAIERTQLYEVVRKGLLAVANELGQAIDFKDAYAGGRSEEKADYAMEIAEEMGIPHSKAETIRIATLLHDIGKIALPQDILHKPDKLTDAEFETIKQHPLISTELLQASGLPVDVLIAIKQHHERTDGRGYPDGLSGSEILKEAAIIEVVDAFGAMTKDRPYRMALSVEEAINQLQEGAGKQYDPEVVKAFLKVLEKKRPVSVQVEKA